MTTLKSLFTFKEEFIQFIKDQQFGCTIKFQRSITSIWAHLQVGLNLTTTKKIQNHSLMKIDFLITMEPKAKLCLIK